MLLVASERAGMGRTFYLRQTEKKIPKESTVTISIPIYQREVDFGAILIKLQPYWHGSDSKTIRIIHFDVYPEVIKYDMQ